MSELKKKKVKYVLSVRLRGDKKKIARSSLLRFQHLKNLLYILINKYFELTSKYLDLKQRDKIANCRDKELIDQLIQLDSSLINIINNIQNIYKHNGSDFFQATNKQVDKEYKSYFALLKKYKNGKIENKPGIPRPKKLDKIINVNYILCHRQFKLIDDNTYLIKPTKDKNLHFNIKFSKLKYIDPNNIKTFGIRMSLTDIYLDIYYEVDLSEFENVTGNYKLGIDLGISNLISAISNNPNLKSFIISGNEIKSFNQWANKHLAKLRSKIDLETDKDKKKDLIYMYRKLFAYRNRRIKSVFHQITNKIIQICKQYGINEIIIGDLPSAKQNINLGSRNNQNFYSIPFSVLINQLKYKGEKYGIKVTIVEEYYTSAKSAITNKIYEKHIYRKYGRGSYFDPKINKIWNADINGAFNIIRCVYKNAFKNFSDKLKLIKLANPIKFNITTLTQSNISLIVNELKATRNLI